MSMPTGTDRLVDLHVHSSYSSDADHSPLEILQMASKVGICSLAITDHDAVDGSIAAQRAAATYGVEVIPAVEITTFFKGRELHVLGYFIDTANDDLDSELARIRSCDETRMREVTARLGELGVDVSYEEARALSPTAVPKCSVIVKAAMSNGRNVGLPLFRPYMRGARSDRPYHNFFLDHMRPGGLAYVEPSFSYAATSAIELIAHSSGISVLAHPGGSLALPRDLAILDSLRGRLAGLEAYSSYHSRELERFLVAYCHDHDLLSTAGSDFHGTSVKPGIEIGDVRNNNYALVEALRRRHWKLQYENRLRMTRNRPT